MIDLIQMRKTTNKLLTEYLLIRRQYKTEKKDLVSLAETSTHIEEAQIIAQQVAQIIQQKAHDQIAGVVSKCLESVFGDVYGFKIRFERKRGRTEAVLLLTKDGNEIEDPMDNDSGGVVDVAAFALRLSCLVLNKPPLRRILLLDEPFKFVSEEYLERIQMLLEKLAEEFKVQIIQVTHIDELKIGKVVRL